MIRDSNLQVYHKKAILKSSKYFTAKNLCESLLLNKVAEKKAPVKVFYCTFCQTF